MSNVMDVGNGAGFGTQGIDFRARKPVDETEWIEAWSALNCEMPAKAESTST